MPVVGLDEGDVGDVGDGGRGGTCARGVFMLPVPRGRLPVSDWLPVPPSVQVLAPAQTALHKNQMKT